MMPRLLSMRKQHFYYTDLHLFIHAQRNIFSNISFRYFDYSIFTLYLPPVHKLSHEYISKRKAAVEKAMTFNFIVLQT